MAEQKMYATAQGSSGTFYLPMDVLTPPVPELTIEPIANEDADMMEGVEGKEEEEEEDTVVNSHSPCERIIYSGNIQMNSVYFGSPMYS